MIESIHIKGYKNLEDFSLDKLARVNLLIGKNNVGKSTFLEAVLLYISKSAFVQIMAILQDRGELPSYSLASKQDAEHVLKAFSSIFNGGNLPLDFKKNITIKAKLQSVDISNALSIRLVEYKNSNGEDVVIDQIQGLINEPQQIYITDKKIGLEVQQSGRKSIFHLDKELIYKVVSPLFTDGFQIYQFVQANNLDRKTNSYLWDNITLSDLEVHVINALQIIEPSIERINFVDEGFGYRVPVAKIKGKSQVVPLRSMGDGINRILTIILSMVNAENGYLLIDEFENGLHHSVQTKLWEIIFMLAEKLNVQVFATTHSEDCIAGFGKMLNTANNSSQGKLIRLENKNGKIVEVNYSAKEIQIAIENNIETR